MVSVGIHRANTDLLCVIFDRDTHLLLRDTRGNPLADDCVPEPRPREAGEPPWDGVRPAHLLAVELEELLHSRDGELLGLHPAKEHVHLSALHAPVALARVLQPRGVGAVQAEDLQEVRQVREGVAERGELPVQYGDDARLGRVEDEVVDLVVSVADCVLVCGEVLREPCYEVAEAGDLAHGGARVAVPRGALELRNLGEGLELPGVEVAGLAVAVEANGGRVYAVHGRERAHGREPAGGAQAVKVGQVMLPRPAVIARKFFATLTTASVPPWGSRASAHP